MLKDSSGFQAMTSSKNPVHSNMHPHCQFSVASRSTTSPQNVRNYPHQVGLPQYRHRFAGQVLEISARILVGDVPMCL